MPGGTLDTNDGGRAKGTIPIVSVLFSFALLPFLGFSAYGDGGAPPPTLAKAGGTPAASPGSAQRSARGDRPGAAVTRVHAVDVASGDVVLSERGKEPTDPMVGQDVLTCSAALALLKPEHRFRTVYWTLGRVKDGTLWGDLLVQGYGDPTVDDVRLRSVARQIALGGVTRITGSIRLDDEYFRRGDEGSDAEAAEEAAEAEAEAEPAEAEEPLPDETTLAADDEEEGEPAAAPITGPSALMFEQNLARLLLRPTRVGARADVMVAPDVGHLVIHPFVETAPYARRVRAVMAGGDEGTDVVLSGAVAPGDPPAELIVRVTSGPQYFGDALYHHLRAQGVKVRRRLVLGQTDGRQRWLLSDFSPQLSEVCEAMLHADHGGRGERIAEALLRTLAVTASGDAGELPVGLATVSTFLEDEVGLVPKSFQLAAPGQPGGRMSPAQLAQVLKAMHARFELRSELELALGAGETQRLLVHQVKDEALLPRVRAVTDTVSGRTAMVGFAAGPAKKVAFAIIVEEAGAEPTSLWARAEEVLARIVEATGPIDRKITQRDEAVEVTLEAAEGG